MPSTLIAPARLGCSRIFLRRMPSGMPGDLKSRSQARKLAVSATPAALKPWRARPPASTRVRMSGPVLGAHPQHDAGIRRLLAPVPVVRVDEAPGGGDRGQRHDARAAVAHLCVRLRGLLEAEHHLGAAIDRDHGLQRHTGAVGDAAHLLDVGGVELADDRHEAPRELLLRRRVHLAALELAAVERDTARHAVRDRLAVGEAALVGRAVDLDAGEVAGGGFAHGRGTLGSGIGIELVLYVLKMQEGIGPGDCI